MTSEVLFVADGPLTASLAPALRSSCTVAVTSAIDTGPESVRRVRPALVIIDMDMANGSTAEICREAKVSPSAGRSAGHGERCRTGSRGARGRLRLSAVKTVSAEPVLRACRAAAAGSAARRLAPEPTGRARTRIVHGVNTTASPTSSSRRTVEPVCVSRLPARLAREVA